jgi:hypothetical protein
VQLLTYTLKYVIRYDGVRVLAKTGRSLHGKEVVKFRYSRQPVDTSKWPETPHVAFANVRGYSLRTGLPTSRGPTRLDLKALLQFTINYGELNVERERDDYFEDPVVVAKMQLIFRNAWREDTKALELINTDKQYTSEFFEYVNSIAETEGVKWPGREIFLQPRPGGPMQANPARTSGGVELVFNNLWTLTRWLFVQDHADGRTKMCGNENCITPYFVIKRKGQKHCSHECAMAVAARRHRRKVSKLIADDRARRTKIGGKRKK